MEILRRSAGFRITALLLIVTAAAAVNADAAAEMLRLRIAYCLETLIPSLFGCMVLANMLTASGAAAWLGYRLRVPARLMRIPPELLTVFLISQTAGYPVGAMLLRQMAEQGRLHPDDAARASYACFGGGPAFLVGLAGVQLFGSAAAGGLILGACVTVNLLLLIFLRPRHSAGCDADAPAVRLSAETLTGSVSGAMRSLGGICGMVLFFGAAMRLSGMERIPHPLARALCTVLTDITQLPALLHCGLHFRTLLAVSAGLLAFGGICVHAQCIALGVSGLHPGRLLLFRMAAAAAVGGIVFLFAGLIALPESVPAFAPQVSVSRTGSPLPALLIFCTGFPILIKKD